MSPLPSDRNEERIKALGRLGLIYTVDAEGYICREVAFNIGRPDLETNRVVSPIETNRVVNPIETNRLLDTRALETESKLQIRHPGLSSERTVPCRKLKPELYPEPHSCAPELSRALELSSGSLEFDYDIRTEPRAPKLRISKQNYRIGPWPLCACNLNGSIYCLGA
ncbi:unnamed protein product [Cyprideis torosa]|uniref:Uncharacterized protein n=1 Tax=Cyprideis torosa TaxID=163714 RepID=A0A7R8WPW7_9CRUS|nr:unnamed protein product [Cyprideis torosa]CAG0907543.1 unnamed protein product [Cyprideis torosa]